MEPTRRRSIALFTTLTLAVVPAVAFAGGRDHPEDDTAGHTTPASPSPSPSPSASPSPSPSPSPSVAPSLASFSLPNGFQPEGIASGPGGRLYIGSIPTGAVYRADPRTGQGSVLVPPHAGRAAIGLKVAGKKLVVAGGATGKAFIYDARTGADVAEVALTTAPTFVNDVTIGKRAAFFTDSQQQQLYRVSLGKDGGHSGSDDDNRGSDDNTKGSDDNSKGSDDGRRGDGSRDDDSKASRSSRRGGGSDSRQAVKYTATTVKITGALQYDTDPATFEANGIAALPNGRQLLVVQSATGKLFKVNGTTGVSTEVVLTGGTLANGDGLLLKGRTLYVVQNRLNQIAVVKLDGQATSGTIERVITNPLFRVPTTIARQGGSLYAVNARFGTPATPDTDYDVVRVDRR